MLNFFLPSHGGSALIKFNEAPLLASTRPGATSLALHTFPTVKSIRVRESGIFTKPFRAVASLTNFMCFIFGKTESASLPRPHCQPMG